MREFLHNDTLKLILFEVSSTGSKGWTMNMCSKPLTGTDISNELQALGATDITDHEVVKKLLRSLDDSFEILSLMIQERPDFKTLDLADIVERLNAHELKLSEKRDMYGSTPKVCALKAKARKVSSDEESEADTDDPETLSRELALLTRKFQRFTKKNHFGNSSRSSSS